ncbi:hypothetical protein GCM10010505_56610 [Kitasatospora aburaviensis]
MDCHYQLTPLGIQAFELHIAEAMTGSGLPCRAARPGSGSAGRSPGSGGMAGCRRNPVVGEAEKAAGACGRFIHPAARVMGGSVGSPRCGTHSPRPLLNLKA